jgi:hypothetical protein
MIGSEPDFLNGKGFTPLTALHSNNRIRGINCLGKAIVLGVLIKKHGFQVKLATCSDHAAVIVCTENGTYLADPNSAELVLLHEGFYIHDNYEWYVASDADCIEYKHIVVHDFDRGILNAIIEHFVFLCTSTKASLAEAGIPVLEQSMFEIANPKYLLINTIQSFNWQRIQKQYFFGLNNYQKDYEIEFLLEYQRVRKLRTLKAMQQHEFDVVVKNAFEKTLNQKFKIAVFRGFQLTYKEYLYDSYKKIAAMLRCDKKGLQVHVLVPKIVGEYLQFLLEEIKKNKPAKMYFLEYTPKIEFDAIEF